MINDCQRWLCWLIQFQWIFCIFCLLPIITFLSGIIRVVMIRNLRRFNMVMLLKISPSYADVSLIMLPVFGVLCNFHFEHFVADENMDGKLDGWRFGKMIQYVCSCWWLIAFILHGNCKQEKYCRRNWKEMSSNKYGLAIGDNAQCYFGQYILFNLLSTMRQWNVQWLILVLVLLIVFVISWV